MLPSVNLYFGRRMHCDEAERPAISREPSVKVPKAKTFNVCAERAGHHLIGTIRLTVVLLPKIKDSFKKRESEMISALQATQRDSK